MKMPTVIKCECCKEDAASNEMSFDVDTKENCCPECTKNLLIAANAMENEWRQSGCVGKLGQLYRGKFHGSSNG